MEIFEPRPLQYEADSSKLLDRLSTSKNIVFLDSAGTVDNGCYCDILAADPTHIIRSRDSVTSVTDRQGECQTFSDDPLAVVARYIPQHSGKFSGGLMGYFSYDLARRIERLPEIARDVEQLPELVLGVYHWAVCVDHQAQATQLVGYPGDGFGAEDFERIYQHLNKPAASPAIDSIQGNQPVQSNMTRASYQQSFDKTKQYIKDGDCYQINLAQKFSVSLDCDARNLYKVLRNANPTPFSAYLEYDDFQILSLSPERFLSIQDGWVETRPIKGTRPRGADPEQDQYYKDDLLSSEKDHAENLMIVDLLRNDLGKVCESGSVTVSKLFAIESFANVHHLVSTVVGQLSEQCTVIDALRACFPGGSITGAPKLRALEIIEELEPDRRGVYCGSIGYIGGPQTMDLNIAIRTAVYKDRQLIFYGGGGIVADSIADNEYQEIFDKVSPITKLF